MAKKKAKKKASRKATKRAPLKNKGKPETPAQVKGRLARNKLRRDTRAALKKAHADAGEIAAHAHAAAILASSRKGRRSRGPGQPPFEPTQEQRTKVTMMAGLGQPHDQIAILTTDARTGLPISVKTLESHFAHELKSGPAVIGANIGQTLYQKAIGNGPGAVTAAIFMARVRLGYQERTTIEIESKSGVLIPPSSMTPVEWVEAMAKKAATAEEPGKKEDDE